MAKRKKPSRTQFKRDKDKNAISVLYLQGIAPIEIPQRLKLPQRYALRLLQELREDWRRANLKSMDERIREELLKIALLEADAWEQYRLSDGDEITESKDKDGVTRTTRKINKTRDPRWHQTIQWCITQRCKLLGLEKTAAERPPDDPETEKAAMRELAMSEEELANLSPDELTERRKAVEELIELEGRRVDLQAILQASHN